MNNKKVKTLRKNYKLTLESTDNFNKNEFRQIKKSTRKQPLEKNEKNKVKRGYKKIA